MILCWGEGHGSAIHDHANSHCFMKMLHGSLQEIRFAWPEKDGEPPKEICRNKLDMNDVCYINGWWTLRLFKNTIPNVMFKLG